MTLGVPDVMVRSFGLGPSIRKEDTKNSTSSDVFRQLSEADTNNESNNLQYSRALSSHFQFRNFYNPDLQKQLHFSFGVLSQTSN